jgi:hypothetical protein
MPDLLHTLERRDPVEQLRRLRCTAWFPIRLTLAITMDTRECAGNVETSGPQGHAVIQPTL